MEKTPIDVSSILQNGRNVHYGAGMEHRSSIYILIGRWPCRADLAADLTAIVGRPIAVDRIHKWANCGAIPSAMQAHVVRAANLRGFDLTAAQMLEMHAVPVVTSSEDAA